MTPVSTHDDWWRAFHQSGDISVTHVDLTPCMARERRAAAWLNEPEQARWRRYLHPRARRDFALCRAALRAMLCRRLGCCNDELTFGALRYGKPYALLRGTPASVSFNVSHGGQNGLIALAPAGRLGVDVEERDNRRDLDAIAQTVFTPAEQAELALARGDRKIRLFFSLWTMKEALIKALGSGFSLNASRFEIPQPLRRDQRVGLFRFPHDPATRWRLENLGNARFAAALAYESGPVSTTASVG
ncbi:MAG: 4'-phosphopantetheinyl transferase superfamily protein [Candidatus Tectomicrobia bacterium]|nr:4'-phosphopantetheinyl transferase superfamily protein [Candidatus Tectomicrobia bacterium]